MPSIRSWAVPSRSKFSLPGRPHARMRRGGSAKKLAWHLPSTYPHIVTIYSVEEAGAYEFIVVELVEGETLLHIAKRQPIELRRGVELGSAGCGRARGSARDQAHSSRHQAVQYPHHPARAWPRSLTSGSRNDSRRQERPVMPRPRFVSPSQVKSWESGVHVAGAGAGRAFGRAHRHLPSASRFTRA